MTAPLKKTSTQAPKDEKDELARKQLLARVAGTVAAGIVSTPSETTTSAEAVAAISVDVAEEILKKIGL